VGNLADILFELSSEERMAILGKLSEKPMKLSHIAIKLKITVAEASRHLQRLSDTEMIQKNSDGLYAVTPHGKLVLSLMSGLDFASRNRDYFSEHSVSAIPPKFRQRIGELSTGKPLMEMMTTFENIQKILQGAEEFAYSMKPNPFPLTGIQIDESIDKKSILQDGFSLLGGRPLLEGVKRRFLSKVEVFLIVTEKKGIIGLPYINGHIDTCGFIGEDPEFREWCKDLFLYYWEEAKPNPSNSTYNSIVDF
jgi:predicted transcriptional regulator